MVCTCVDQLHHKITIFYTRYGWTTFVLNYGAKVKMTAFFNLIITGKNLLEFLLRVNTVTKNVIKVNFFCVHITGSLISIFYHHVILGDKRGESQYSLLWYIVYHIVIWCIIVLIMLSNEIDKGLTVRLLKLKFNWSLVLMM